MALPPNNQKSGPKKGKKKKKGEAEEAPSLPPAKEKPAHLVGTEAYVKEAQSISAGKDRMEYRARKSPEHVPGAFVHDELVTVRDWKTQRPLEPMQKAAPMVPIPNSWERAFGRHSKIGGIGRKVLQLIRGRKI